MPASSNEVFEFFMDARNLPAISPPFPPFRLLTPAKRTESGDVQVLRLGVGPASTTWEARVTQVRPGRLIEDVQDRGPFRRWRHQHRVEAEGDRARLTDVVSFRLLPTAAGEFFEFYLVRPAIFAMFAFRHWKSRRLFAHHKS